MNDLAPIILTVGERERATQDRVITLFEYVLGYDYLGNWIDRPDNSNIEVDILRSFLLSQNHTEHIVDKAIHELQKVA